LYNFFPPPFLSTIFIIFIIFTMFPSSNHLLLHISPLLPSSTSSPSSSLLLNKPLFPPHDLEQANQQNRANHPRAYERHEEPLAAFGERRLVEFGLALG
jgi:hypothetical protein